MSRTGHWNKVKKHEKRCCHACKLACLRAHPKLGGKNVSKHHEKLFEPKIGASVSATMVGRWLSGICRRRRHAVNEIRTPHRSRRHNHRGENRSFDQLFAKYVAEEQRGQSTQPAVRENHYPTVTGPNRQAHPSDHLRTHLVASIRQCGSEEQDASTPRCLLRDLGGVGAYIPYVGILSLRAATRFAAQEQVLSARAHRAFFTLGPDTASRMSLTWLPGPFQMTGPRWPADAFQRRHNPYYFQRGSNWIAIDRKCCQGEPDRCLHDLQSAGYDLQHADDGHPERHGQTRRSSICSRAMRR